MTTLFAVFDALAAHGPTVLLGASLVLLAGMLAMRCTSHGAERRRLGVWTGAAVGIYLLVAFVPMQRWQVDFEVTDPAPAAEPPQAAELLPRTADATPPVNPQVRLAALQAQVERILDAEPVAVPDAGAAIQPPANEPVAPTPWPFRRLAAGAYVLAAVLLLLRHALGFHRLHRLLRRCQPAPAALLHGMPLPKLARVLVAEHAVRPFCAGWRRPVIVLPRSLLEPQRRSQARAVLRHEAAHLQAGDPAVQMLFALLAVPLGLHPLFWWLVREVRFQCELLADDAAAAADRADYARELIDLAERAAPALQAVGTVSVFHRPSDFYRRMQMLLQREGRLIPSSSRLRRTAQAMAAFLCVGVAASVLGVPLRAQEPTPESALQQQNDKLRAELDALRAELRDLQSSLQFVTRDGKAAGVGGVTLDDVSPRTLGELEALLSLQKAQWDSVRRTAQENAAPRSYTVQKGDSLRTIAKQLLGSADRVDELMAANPGIDPTRLRVGQNVLLPARPSLPNEAPTNQTKPNAVQDPQPAGVPVLKDIPILNTLFENNQKSTGSAGRTTEGNSAEATADLASRYLDLQGELEVAEVTATEQDSLAKAGRAMLSEARRAASRRDTLQKKVAIVRRLIDGEIQATQSELQWLDRRLKDLDKTERLPVEAQVQRAQVRLEVLRSVK